jgi:hypothetical protein
MNREHRRQFADDRHRHKRVEIGASSARRSKSFAMRPSAASDRPAGAKIAKAGKNVAKPSSSEQQTGERDQIGQPGEKLVEPYSANRPRH